jgi:hypothetical protein
VNVWVDGAPGKHEQPSSSSFFLECLSRDYLRVVCESSIRIRCVSR